MSARIRIIKRRIRMLESSIEHLCGLVYCYERVIADISDQDLRIALGTRRQDWVDQIASLNHDLRRENDLLASMPKRHGASPHDPGDEQQHRYRKPGEWG